MVNYRNSISNSGGGPELSYILYPEHWNAFGIGGFARYLTYGDITAGLQAVDSPPRGLTEPARSDLSLA